MGSSETKHQQSVTSVANGVNDRQVIKKTIQVATIFLGDEENSTTDTFDNQRISSVHSVDIQPVAVPMASISHVNDPTTTKCVSCALHDIKRDVFHWELIDSNVLHTALNFREELAPCKNDSQLKNKIYTIYKGYLALRLDDLEDKSVPSKIRALFKEAMQQCNPELIIMAYSLDQSFTKLLNNDMARIVLHDIAKGCSKFSCDTLYTTQDGTKAIASILFYHPKFTTYEGTVYRGSFSPIDLAHIEVNRCIMTTTFLSTSKSLAVADQFSAYSRSEKKFDIKDESQTSIVCTYIIKNLNKNRRALDISQYSNHPEEEEVLLMPYSVFMVTKKEMIDIPNGDGRRIEIELEEWDETKLRPSLNLQ